MQMAVKSAKPARGKSVRLKPTRRKRHRYTLRDHLIAYVVLLVIVGVIILGAVGLYLTGIFTPVEYEPALSDTVPLEFATPPPLRGMLDWLFPVASAEGPDGTEGLTTWMTKPPDAGESEPDPDATPEPEQPRSEDELESLLADIIAEEEAEIAITDAERVTVDRSDLAINENLPDHIYNVLLMATDDRGGYSPTGRTDVMIVASLNMQTGELKLSSLSRDLYVAIPGVTSNKLNAAHAYGGPNLAMKTVNSVFELNIEDYIAVDFRTMADIVDSFGGVDILLAPEEYFYINYNVAVSEDYEGFAKSTTRRTLTEKDQDVTVHLDGLQAVAYARIRKLDNDLQRGSRQRILLNALMEKGLSNLSPSTFYSLATSLISSTSTNLKLTKVIEIGTWLLQNPNVSMHEMSIPVPGSYRSGTEKDVSVLIFNQGENVRTLHDFFFGTYIPAEAE